MLIKSQIETKLDAEIQSALDTLASFPDKTTKEYGTIVDHVATLYKLKTESRSKQLSPDTMLTVSANIFGILWLTRFERNHVISAKSAFGQIMKPK
jgi:hypothetical protein